MSDAPDPLADLRRALEQGHITRATFDLVAAALQA